MHYRSNHNLPLTPGITILYFFPRPWYDCTSATQIYHTAHISPRYYHTTHVPLNYYRSVYFLHRYVLPYCTYFAQVLTECTSPTNYCILYISHPGLAILVISNSSMQHFSQPVITVLHISHTDHPMFSQPHLPHSYHHIKHLAPSGLSKASLHMYRDCSLHTADLSTCSHPGELHISHPMFSL